MSTSIYCPYCSRYTLLTRRGEYPSPYGLYWIGECNSCHKAVLINDQLNEKYPLSMPKPVDPRIPEPIRNDFKESQKCLSIGAHRAAGVMARRALQNCCLDKGAKENDRLEKQIDWLYNQGIITKGLKEWAHEVRLTGNDAAHPSKPGEDTPVTKEDAEDILSLLEQLTSVLYIAPAIAEERRKLRSKTK